MKRIAVFVILILLLGTLTTVSVAWGLSIWELSELRSVRTGNSGGRGWAVVQYQSPGVIITHIEIQPNANSEDEPRLDAATLLRGGSLPKGGKSLASRVAEHGGPHIIVDELAGWPRPALWCRWERSFRRPLIENAELHGGIICPLDLLSTSGWVTPTLLPWYATDMHALPLIPHWSGFAVNVAFYSTVWSIPVVLAMCVSFVKQRRRRRRNRCVSCAYNLAQIESARCPECGWARGHRVRLLSRRWVKLSGWLVVSVIVLNSAAAILAISFRAGPEPIHQAARRGDLRRLQKLIDGGVSVEQRIAANDPVIKDHTPLIEAARHGQVEAVKYLIERGARIDAYDNTYHATALLYAVRGSEVEVIATLAAAGADLENTNPSGLSALVWAMWDPIQEEAIKALVASGADVNADARYGGMILGEIILRGSDNLISYLIDEGVSFDDESLHLKRFSYGACRRGDIRTLRRLSALGVDLTRPTYDLYICAADSDSPEVVQYLMEIGAPIFEHPDGATSALHRAAIQSKHEMVRALLEAGYDPMYEDRSGKTALMRLRAHRAQVPAEDWSPEHEAAFAEVVAMLEAAERERAVKETEPDHEREQREETADPDNGR